MLTRVILAIDDPPLLRRMRRVMAHPDVIVDGVRIWEKLLEQLGRESYDLAVIGQHLLQGQGAEVIASLRQFPDSPEVVVLCDREDPEEQAGWLAAECSSVLYAGLPDKAMREVLATILNRRRETVEKGLTVRPGAIKPLLSDFVSNSPAMQAFMGVVQRVAGSDTSLLLTGETGVGKEHLARSIHAESARARGPFIAVNCGALPDALLESELFGHEEGAFTGASRARRGWFELSHRGTIFLDEIGEMPLHLQVKLLQVLQTREVRRVGGETSFAVDVRVMAATNRDLPAEMEAGNFRRDLYYRLSVVSLHIPPLRERKEDIPTLVESYIHFFLAQIRRYIGGVSKEAMDALCNYSWPGNVRELINVVERAMLLCEPEGITLADLPESISGRRSTLPQPLLGEPAAAGGDATAEAWLHKPLRDVRRDVIAETERAYLAGQLKATGGRIGETARRAGLQPRSLFEKMKLYDLHKEDFKLGHK